MIFGKTEAQKQAVKERKKEHMKRKRLFFCLWPREVEGRMVWLEYVIKWYEWEEKSCDFYFGSYYDWVPHYEMIEIVRDEE